MLQNYENMLDGLQTPSKDGLKKHFASIEAISRSLLGNLSKQITFTLVTGDMCIKMVVKEPRRFNFSSGKKISFLSKVTVSTPQTAHLLCDTSVWSIDCPNSWWSQKSGYTASD